MKPRVSREEMIHATIDLITRYGIRAVRVDEISSALGISKRTLYETFEDKNALIVACIEEISKRQQAEYMAYLEEHSAPEESLDSLFWLLDRLIRSLYFCDTSYLHDVCHQQIYRPLFLTGQQFWGKLLCELFERGVENGYLLREVLSTSLSGYLLRTFYNNRIDGLSLEEQLALCRALVRGIATPKGIEQIDAN